MHTTVPGRRGPEGVPTALARAAEILAPARSVAGPVPVQMPA